MEQVIKLVKTYRVTAGLAERLQLADEIFRLVEPDLRFFILGAVRSPVAEDVLQEVLKGIATGMGKFVGGSKEEFWAWCYRIARNKLNDHYRKHATDRLQPMPDDELSRLVESSAAAFPISAADLLDLEYAMNLLARSKPDCREFLWQHYVVGRDYSEIAEERSLSYDNVRMRIGRCLDIVKALIS